MSDLTKWITYRKVKKRKKVFLWSALMVLMMGSWPLSAYAKEPVIKVGYSSDCVQKNEDGTYRGYMAEYLAELAKHTGWTYEFEYDTMKNNLKKLQNGELDLLGMMRMSDERKEMFIYSDLSMVSDYTALCAAVDSDIYYRDYDAIAGCAVGVVTGSTTESAFLSYDAKHGLNCRLVYFATEAEAEAALQRGSIKLMVMGGLSHHPDLKLVDRFQLESAYFMTEKNNTELMDALNEAMQQVRMENLHLESNLVKKYYRENTSTNLFLTREEIEYLKSAEPIVIKGLADGRPLRYKQKDGGYTGVLIEYLDALSQISGLKFVHDSTDVLSVEEHAKRMQEEQYGVLLADHSLEHISTETPVQKSVPLFSTRLTYVKRSEDADVTEKDDDRFALLREMSYLEDELKRDNKDVEVLYYDTADACMEAVARGEADITIQREQVVTYLMQKPEYEDHLMISFGTEQAGHMCLYVSADQEPVINILNKTMDSLSEDTLTRIMANSMLKHSYEYTLEDFVYEYQYWIWFVSGMMVLILGLGWVLHTRIKKSKLEREENERLQKQIQRDPLTGLYNREHFFIKAREMIDSAKDEICIVRLNICNFKIVNEIHGAEKGDQLLCEIGKGLKEFWKSDSAVYGRFTSDHFYICISHDEFKQLNVPKGSNAPNLGMDISLSYGVYMVGEQKDIPVNIMCDRANMANASKENTAMDYIRYYSDQERLRLLHDQEIENDMVQAVEERQFRIYVQPKYNIETEEIVGGEVLVRWFHPQKGMISPGAFIGLFERNGFIRNLDYYIWEESCRFIAELKKKGIRTGPLSVNVSRIHFYGWEFKEKLMGFLKKYDLDARELELEITESICSEDAGIIFEKCENLRREGFRIAMDDFGSGYSSLNMLKNMPLDIIKMDLGFLSGGTDEVQRKKGQDILHTLITLSHSLGLKVVVEGLETQEQRDFIQQIGNCDVQGYYYSRPVDSPIYEDMITT